MPELNNTFLYGVTVLIWGYTWFALMGATFTAVLALVTGRSFDFEWTSTYVVSLLYLAIFGSVVLGFSLVLRGNLLVLMQSNERVAER